MTAFEPPDFEYFPGLQFNPEIYENTLTDTATLPINPSFNSVTAPIMYTDSIQRDTATQIHLFDAFPIVTDIIMGLQGMFFFFGSIVITGSAIIANGLPSIALGDGSVDAIVNGLITYIQGSTAIDMNCGSKIRIEPTLAYIRSATTTIQNASATIIASFTSALSSVTGTEFRVVSQTAATLASFTNSLISLASTAITLNTATFKVQAAGVDKFAQTAVLTVIENNTCSINQEVRVSTLNLGNSSGTCNLKGQTNVQPGTGDTLTMFDSSNVRSLQINTDATGTTMEMNFRNSTASPAVTTASIIVKGGTATAFAGTMILNGIINFSTGFSFTNGNLTSGAYYIQTGNSANQAALGGGASNNGSVTFSDAYATGTTPFVVITVEYTAAATLSRVIGSTCSVTNASFTWIASNPFSNASSAYRIRYIVIGQA
jgi:hypothetical protein